MYASPPEARRCNSADLAHSTGGSSPAGIPAFRTAGKSGGKSDCRQSLVAQARGVTCYATRVWATYWPQICMYAHICGNFRAPELRSELELERPWQYTSQCPHISPRPSLCHPLPTSPTPMNCRHRNSPLRGYVRSGLINSWEERTDEGEYAELDTEHGQVEDECGDERRGRRRGRTREVGRPADDMGVSDKTTRRTRCTHMTGRCAASATGSGRGPGGWLGRWGV